MSVVDLQNFIDRRREDFRIVVRPALWRGFETLIEPPTATHPLRHFRTYGEAMDCAEAIQRTEGWPLFSNCGDEPPPPRAA